MTLTPNKIPPPVADDPRWRRILARDKTADGQLWYSVATTGVYCRPSCPSRTANPKNVQLHETLQSARATGFRPCRRCNPEAASLESENAALIAKACRIIEESEEEPSLKNWQTRRPQPELFSSPVQGCHRAYTEGICRRPPGEEDPARTGCWQQRHRGDL